MSDAEGPGTLFLVRHGQSTWNLDGRIQGQSPAAGGLTPTGRDEAARATRWFAERGVRAAAIVSSDLPRTAETARIIADLVGLPVEFDPGLREMRLGVFEGRRIDEAASQPAGNTDRTVQDAVDELWRDPGLHPPGGESVAELYERVRGALRRPAAARPGADVIVVTHGGPVRVAVLTSPPTPGREVPRIPVANASITAWTPSASAPGVSAG